MIAQTEEQKLMPDEHKQPPNQPQPNLERKTLDERGKMTELERIRHSCAHVMATALLRLWPDAQFASGPPVENGFYYDVELSHRITPEDFPRIEAEMKQFLSGVEGIDQVEAEMVLRPPWTPEMMSEEAKAALGFF